MRSEVLALGAAVCTAAASILMAELAGRMSAIAVTRWSMIVATALSGAIATGLGGWSTIEPASLGYLMLSGFFAIIIAGPNYYGSIFRIGPRNAVLMFSLNAPIAGAIGFLLFGDRFGVVEGLGIALVLIGIALAVRFGDPRQKDRGAPVAAATTSAGSRRFWAGVAFGLMAAAGQGAGNVAAKPAMVAHAEPFTAMAIRSGTAALFFLLLALLPVRALKSGGGIDRRSFGIIALATAVGMGIGMTMLMASLAEGNVGICSTLAAMTPVAVLPMVWARTGRAPSWQAWAGAVLAVAGTGLILWK